MPKVSVIIPVYGVEKYLREALDSVINQTLKDIEIIILDDGGKDGCPVIIDEYASKDSRIIAIHKPNGGYGQTCNVGLEKATGEYIAIMEPDDYIDTHMYEDLYNIAVKNNSDIVKSPFYENFDLSEYKKIRKIKWKEEDQIPEETFTIEQAPMFLYYHPSIWSAIYKKEFLNNNNIRFIEAPGAGWTDNPFQVQTMCLAKRINYTSNPYYYWRILNKYQSDDLKDYTLPFKRSDEIHKWLEENNKDSELILANLYKRELVYINIVLGMKTIFDEEDCYNRIKQMCLRMNENIILNNKLITKNEKKLYYKFLKHPKKFHYIQLFIRKSRDLIQIHINHHNILIKLFNKTIFSMKYEI